MINSHRIEPLEARIAPAFAGVLELSGLDGLNGFKISGVPGGDQSTSSVSSAGDVNGDGFEDVIVGASKAEPNGFYTGASYVVFGTASSFASNINLSDLNGSNGFKINGVVIGGASGSSVSSAGDVNGDGIDDLLIGAPRADSGASYVVFGKSSGFAASFDISSLDGANGFKISGGVFGDEIGRSVSSAGDVNGDGFDDLIIGAPKAEQKGVFRAGASYVVFGKASGFTANLDVSTLNGANGFTISGASAGEVSGSSVSSAGDVNGDGFDDVIVDAPGEEKTYVIFGKAGAFPASLDLATLDGIKGFAISGVAGADVSASSVSSAGDVNGDGYADVIIGAPQASSSGRFNSGAAYVVFGKADGFTSNLDISTLSGANGFRIPGGAVADRLGSSVSSAGDVNGDGFDDLIIGAPGADPKGVNSGASYLVFGKASWLAADFDVSMLNGANGVLIAGAAQYHHSGQSVSGAGDVNGDGLADLIIAAPTNSTNPSASYVVFGRPAPVALSISATSSVAEGNAGSTDLNFTVSLSAASAEPVAVRYKTQAGTAQLGSDFAGIEDALLTFAPGETSKVITIRTVGDLLHELDETFSVVLSSPLNADILNGTGIGTILNDDAPPVASITGAAVLEGNAGTSSISFVVSLSAPSGLPVSLEFATENATAVAGDDYTALSPGVLTFAPGETSKTITVEVLGDTAIETDEQFTLALSNPVNATLPFATATGTIYNDDTSLRIAETAMLEGHAGTRPLIFTISLTAPSALPVSVDFASLDGSALGGLDYISLTPGTLIFAPGETSKNISVEIIGDTAVEPTETFTILLAGPLNASLENDTAAGTILDDDVTLVSARKASYIDPEGDLVTIKVNKGTLKVEDFTLLPSGLGSRLVLVDFSNEPEFTGTNLTIKTKRTAGAEGATGLVQVDHIDASGIDLGKVVVNGDLGRIDAGNALTPKGGLLSLSVNAMGTFSEETQLPGGSLQSDIVGSLKKLKLTAGMQDVTLSASGDIGAIAIKGGVFGSVIHSDGRIGSVKIGGDLAKSAAGESVLSARGALESKTSAKAIAIGRLSIGGTVDHAQILAGYNRSGEAVNPTAGIAAVSVGRDWIASNLVAGVAVGEDGYFGTDDDLLIGRNNLVAAKIASVIIKGNADGTEAEGDHFGFVASEIHALRIGGVKHAFNSGPGNDLAGYLFGSTSDLMAREIA